MEIGDFVFVVEERTLDNSETAKEEIEDENVDLREISAEDLIDLLGEEIRAIEEFEAAQVNGADALLETARQTEEVQALENVPEEIEVRSAELDRREKLLADKATYLQKAQIRLETYLQQLTAQARSETDGDGDKPFRKTA